MALDHSSDWTFVHLWSKINDIWMTPNTGETWSLPQQLRRHNTSHSRNTRESKLWKPPHVYLNTTTMLLVVNSFRTQNWNYNGIILFTFLLLRCFGCIGKSVKTWISKIWLIKFNVISLININIIHNLILFTHIHHSQISYFCMKEYW